MTARVNIVINYGENKVEVYKALEGNGSPTTEKEELFASTAMTMLQKMNMADADIEHVLDLGSTIVFEENPDEDVCIKVFDNGRNQVIGSHHSTSYRLASSVVKEMSSEYESVYDYDEGFDDEYDYDYDEELTF